MADMSQWQGKSQKRHNLDGFAVMFAPLRRHAFGKLWLTIWGHL
jgi:hypothetical protein